MTKYSDYQRGSTTVEFLIFMPVVAALMYFSHDLNIQIARKQDIFLANQSMFDSNLSEQNALQDFGRKTFQAMGGKCELQAIVQEQQPDEPTLLARLSNNKLVGENTSPIFLAYQTMQESQMELASNYASTIGPAIVSIFPEGEQKIVQLTTYCPANGEEAMFAGAAHHLLSVFDRAETGPTAASGEAGQLFFKNNTSYHADWLGDWSLLGQLLAVDVENAYGLAGANDNEEAHFQSYCMTNLGSSSVCGDIEFLWMDNPSEFPQYSYDLAQNKMGLYELLGEAEMATIQNSLQTMGNLPSLQNTFLDDAHTSKVIGQLNHGKLAGGIKFLHLDEELSLPDISLSQGLESKLCLKEVLP
ncbi:MAG: hypothetical protein A2X86_20215 [Bdellovibrionales bacterium GWA2_49_15]|nr:MAG: hypothetical protein A2X86_20215 [Bdellovibrionales bacterium GWA2_49_15]HAZ11362.1 hypothetical protein [Bdellovibrionales bacterium]